MLQLLVSVILTGWLSICSRAYWGSGCSARCWRHFRSRP